MYINVMPVDYILHKVGNMNDYESIITDFIKAWSRLDAIELSNYFNENGIYHNIPINPVTGRKNIKEFIKSFTATWKATTWEIINSCLPNALKSSPKSIITRNYPLRGLQTLLDGGGGCFVWRN